MAGAVLCAGSKSSEQDRQRTCLLEAFILGRKTDEKIRAHVCRVCVCVCVYVLCQLVINSI